VDLPVGNADAPEPPPGDEALEAEADGLRFVVSADGGALREGVRGTLRLRLHNPRGELVLEPVMGAFAHVVAFDPARSGVAHLHPLDTEGAWDSDRCTCELTFSVAFPQAGTFRLWVQTHASGREQLVPFTLRVLPGA
jgi:hypothetical protein